MQLTTTSPRGGARDCDDQRMRCAIKTAPQVTTWQAMLEVWCAADNIELFESAWNFDHFEPVLGKPRNGPCRSDLVG